MPGGSFTESGWGNGLMYCITYLFHPPFSTFFLAVYPDKSIILIKTDLGAEWIPAGYCTVCDIKQQINKHAAHHVCNYCAQLYSVGELVLTSPCLFSAESWLPLLQCRIWKSFLRWVIHFRGTLVNITSVERSFSCEPWVRAGQWAGANQVGGQPSLASRASSGQENTWHWYISEPRIRAQGVS